MIVGKLEITIKINELAQAKTLENSWQQFDIDCDTRIISVTVKPKWNKLTDAAGNYPQWVAAMSKDKPRSIYACKLGQQTDNGFVFDEPLIYKFLSASLNQRQQPRLVLLEPG